MRTFLTETCKTCSKKQTNECKKSFINIKDEACCLWKSEKEEWENEDDKKKLGI